MIRHSKPCSTSRSQSSLPSGYCNHSLTLMLKACKFSLYGSQNSEDLENEADQIPDQACTSKLQTWHQKGRGETIYPQLWMWLSQKPNWRIQNVKTKGFILSFTRQEIMQCTTVQRSKKFKQAIRDINPQMGLAQIVDLGSEIHLKETRFGIVQWALM